MNKTVKVILKQTSLRNNLLKCRCEANKRSYKGQRHLCPVDIVVYRNVTDSKTWWNSITPSVIKIINKENITVVEIVETPPNSQWISENFEYFFCDLRKSSSIPQYKDLTVDSTIVVIKFWDFLTF